LVEEKLPMLSDIERRVLDKVDPELVVRWTRELTRIPSVYRPKEGQAEEAAARWIKARFEELGLQTTWEVVEPGRPNVIGILPGAKDGQCLMFEGHTDVVTEGDASSWTHPPFEAEVVDGRIYGRGVNDMKGGLVAAIVATKAILDSGVKLDGAILIGALVDEEGEMKGVKDFVARGWGKRVTAAVICEPEDNRLCIEHKGVMWIKITMTGVMAHGAMPLTGVNPIHHAVALLREVKAWESEEIRIHGEHHFMGQPSITPTIVQAPECGEPQNNVLPARATVTLDFRLLPSQSPEDMESKLKGILTRLKEADPTFDAVYEVIDCRPPISVRRDEPLVTTLDGAYRDTTGKEPVYGAVPGSTDGTILFTKAGIPVVTCGPGDTFIPHHIDEYLDIDQLIDATRLYALTALRYLGVAAS
jgi:succinyl-diaminopimelate desuccinylase